MSEPDLFFVPHLKKAFYGFEPDFFQQNLLRIVDDVIGVTKGSIELWPSLLEICYFHKSRKGLPQIRVKNQKRRGARKENQKTGSTSSDPTRFPS
jgi:hypothetical protein